MPLRKIDPKSVVAMREKKYSLTFISNLLGTSIPTIKKILEAEHNPDLLKPLSKRRFFNP